MEGKSAGYKGEDKMDMHLARRIPMEGALNVRELGGLPLKDGRMVRHGSLIRTGRLSDMTEADKETLARWNLTKIIDMRNNQEVCEHPDPTMDGVEWIQLSIFPGGAAGISREDNGETLMDKAVRLSEMYAGGKARKLLQTMYPRMVGEEFCVAQIRRFFDLLLEHEDGAVAWHCTSGKDRTGLTCALLLYVLGAEKETILEDYLETNDQIADYRNALLDGLRQRGIEEEKVQQIYYLESVDVAYLDSCMEVITEKYGTLDRFVEEYLGITREKRTALLEKYTVRSQE